MNNVSITYAIKFRINFAPEYCFTNDNFCINLKTGRKIKQVYNNRCIGYVIKSKFYSLKKLRPCLEKIESEYCPF